MTSISQAVIFAGGMGTRLRPLTDNLPKPMIDVNGRPFLEYLIQQLKKNEIEEVVLLLGYLHQKVTSHFGDGSKFNLKIKYSISPIEDNTGTRLQKASDLLRNHFLLLNCDNYWPLELKKFINFYDAKNVLIATAVYSNKDGISKNNVTVDMDGYITKFDQTRTSEGLNGVNLAYAITSRKVLDLMPKNDFDYEKEIFPILISQRKLAGCLSDDRYYGIGSLARLREIELFFNTHNEENKSDFPR